jgi:hypothetical protein
MRVSSTLWLGSLPCTNRLCYNRDLYFCYFMKFLNTGVCCLLTSCPHLELADVSGCIHISNVSLNVAINKVRQAEGCKKLNLVMTGVESHYLFFMSLQVVFRCMQLQSHAVSMSE